MQIPDEPIKYWSDYQCDWKELIRPLRPGRFTVETTASLSIHGDAPKCFVRMREYVPGRRSSVETFIAKVGSKYYPIESVTEHLITRIGQECGIRVADSQLRLVGNQVRFLSKYFLKPNAESLTHGIEIFKDHLSEEIVNQIAAERREQEFYTFQTVCAAVRESFPVNFSQIMRGLVEMLAFDALVGNNDRHPANWGVIVPVLKSKQPRFSPVFDTARGLFWNSSEVALEKMDSSRLAAYVNGSKPQIGWDGWKGKLTHFDLIRLIASSCAERKRILERLFDAEVVKRCSIMIEEEFGQMMSERRRRLVRECLRSRYDRFCTSVNG